MRVVATSMRILLACVLALAACGRSLDCLPAPATTPPECPLKTFVDTSVNDSICLNKDNGEPLCRAGNFICYVCAGQTFVDGCYIHAENNKYECVHHCDAC